MAIKKYLLLVSALVLALTLAACGGSDSSSTLVVASGAEAVTFDIQATNDQATSRVARQMYETLIFQTEELELVPGLALSWEDIGDNTYEFTLRQGVTFHNGETFTADDVAFTIQRATQSPTIGHIVGAIDPDKIEVVDDYTIRLGTKTPFGPFLTHLAHPATAILNRKAVTEAGEDYGTTVVVGTGPYEFEEWVVGSQISVVRFEDYWGTPALTDRIEFKTIVESSVRLIGLENGEIDIIYDVAPADTVTVEANSELTLINTPNLGAEYLGLNVASNEYLQDINVRKAIAHIMDIAAIVESIYSNVGTQMTGPINSSVFGYNPDLEAYAYDEALAAQFLADSQWPNGGFSLDLYVGDNSQQRIQVAQVVQSQLAKLNITVTIRQMEWGAFLAETAKPAEDTKTDMFLLGWTTVTADADYGLYPLFHSQSGAAGGNRTFYANARVDELLDLGRNTDDQEARLAAYQEAQAIINDELPWVFLQTRENVSAIRNTVTGFVHHPMGTYLLSGVSKSE
jgi:peptide/nickel transport system substrate-binding protein